MSRSPQGAGSIFRSRFFQAVGLCAVLYLLACVGCASFQRRFIYLPPVFDTNTVNQIGASANLERWTSPSNQPIGWKRLSPTQPARGQVLITHGNAGCAVQCQRYPDVIQQVAPFDVFIVEYPGYADSPGKPTEVTLEAAAEEGFRLLTTNTPIYLLGESLGTGVAAFLAGVHSNQVAGVVLLAPYNSLVSVAQEHMPLLPVSLMLVDRFPAGEFLHNYHGPLAVLVAGKDQVIPEKFGRRLYDGYAGPKRLWEFPNGNHGTVMEQPPEIWRQIVDFWQTNHPTLNSDTNAP
jgi:pimeloyl-ACP methyl ester carboxylesterase